jgi:hypothetical protein
LKPEFISTLYGALSTMVHHFNRFGTFVAAATFATGLCTATTLAQSTTCAGAAAAVVGSNPFATSAGTGNQIVTTNAAGTLTTTINNARWFSFTPATTGNYEFSACGSVGDTKLAIGTACPAGNFLSLAYNDDSCACSSGCTGNYSSRLNASNTGLPLTGQLTAGTTYYVVIGGFGSADVPSGNLVISASAPPPPPSNPCLNPQVAVLGANTLPSNATNPNLPVSCGTVGATAASKASYLKFTAPSSASYTVDTCAGTTDTIMAVLTTCGDAATEIACNDDFCGLRSQVTFDATAGSVYYIAVGMWSTTAAPPANFLVNVAEALPPSDPCLKTAEAVVGSNTVNSTPGGPVCALGCGEFLADANNPTYVRFTAPAAGTYVAGVCGNAADDTAMGVLTICGDASSSIACDDDGCGIFIGPSQVVFSADAGVEYFIAIGMFDDTTAPPATFELVIAEAADVCGETADAVVGANTLTVNPNAAPLTVPWVPITISTVNYLRFTPDQDGTFTASACANSGVDTVVFIMTECGVGDSEFIGANDNCGEQFGPSTVTWPGTAGTTYYIAVGGYDASVILPPTLEIEVSAQYCTQGFDPCAAGNVTTVQAGMNSVPVDCGAPNLDLSCCWTPELGDPVIAKANFMRYVASASGPVTVNTCSQCVDARLAVLTSCGTADSSNFVAADDDGCADKCFSSSLTFDAVAGTTYFIAIGGYIAPGLEATVPATMDVEISALNPCDPANIGVAQIGENQVIPSSAYPALDVAGSPCTFPFLPQAIASAKYFTFVPGATGLHLFEQCGDTGTTVDCRMGILTSCGDASTFLICDDDGCTAGAAPYTSRFEIELTAGQTYYLVVGGYSAAQTGPFNIVISGPEPQGCVEDLNNDGFINGQDLGILLGNWGACTSTPCQGDFTGDGFVNGQDLGVLLGAWGACPN